MKVLLLDLLALCGCRHFDHKCIDVNIEIYKSECWSIIQKTIIEFERKEKRGSQDRYVIYVSKTSYDQLFRSNLLRNQINTADSRSGAIFLRYILLHIKNLVEKSDGLIKLASYRGECDLSGYHSEEYCDLREALKDALRNRNLMCGIICIDKTFSDNNLEELKRELRAELGIHHLMETHNARIVEIAKEST